MIRVAVRPEVLRWARERAGLAQEDLAGRFRRLRDWEAGKAQPTLKQVEAFACAVHAPTGYLFLSAPPEESVPIPDFRTVAGQTLTRPSPRYIISSCPGSTCLDPRDVRDSRINLFEPSRIHRPRFDNPEWAARSAVAKSAVG